MSARNNRPIDERILLVGKRASLIHGSRNFKYTVLKEPNQDNDILVSWKSEVSSLTYSTCIPADRLIFV